MVSDFGSISGLLIGFSFFSIISGLIEGLKKCWDNHKLNKNIEKTVALNFQPEIMEEERKINLSPPNVARERRRRLSYVEYRQTNTKVMNQIKNNK